MKNGKARIFLNTNRIHFENEWLSTCATVPDNCANENEKVTSDVFYLLQEETLAGGRSINHTVKQNSLVVLLPVVGTVEFISFSESVSLVQAGEVQTFFVRKDCNFTVTNPYNDNLVNYLLIYFKAYIPSDEITNPTAYSIIANKNRTVEIVNQYNGKDFVRIAIGQFDGRMEGQWPLCRTGNTVFVFVIDGAFEVENRLLERGDGLALYEQEHIEYEALSPDAILLLIESGSCVLHNSQPKKK